MMFILNEGVSKPSICSSHHCSPLWLSSYTTIKQLYFEAYLALYKRIRDLFNIRWVLEIRNRLDIDHLDNVSLQ